MSLSERWTLIVGRNGDIHGFAFPSGNRHLITNPHMDSREVEVVPAEQLRGAVAIREAGEEVIAAWDAMDGSEASRGALMGAFGTLRLAIGEGSR